LYSAEGADPGGGGDVREIDLWNLFISVVVYGLVIMRGANRRKEGRKSRLAKLHDLILRGNLLLGRLYGLIWTGVRWLWPASGSLYRATIEIGTFLGIAFLVYDAYFQTEATVSSVASDPQDVFYFPFSLTNNSHIFSIRHIKWGCDVEHLRSAQNATMDHVGIMGSGSEDEIPPNGTLNMFCRSVKIEQKIVEARILVLTDYYVSVFGLEFHRTPAPTRFTWLGGASNPQWIKGALPNPSR
jgi:hypothetical protein